MNKVAYEMVSLAKELIALSVPEQHQKAIALKTLKMNDAMAKVMGGMSKEEAREFLKGIGYTDRQIEKIEAGRVASELVAVVKDLTARNWSEVSYGYYLGEIQRMLDSRKIELTDEMMDFIAECQEEGIPPQSCIRDLERGGWKVHSPRVARELAAVGRELMAIDFPTQDAFDKYMKDHPDADKTNHRVVETKKEEHLPSSGHHSHSMRGFGGFMKGFMSNPPKMQKIGDGKIKLDADPKEIKKWVDRFNKRLGEAHAEFKKRGWMSHTYELHMQHIDSASSDGNVITFKAK